MFKQKIYNIINNKKFVLPIFIIGFIMILYHFIFFVIKNSVDIPFWDQWNLVDVITNKTDILKILSYQHNEHRIGVGLLITKILANFSNWSQIVEIYFISTLVILSTLILTYIKYNINKRLEFLDLLIPLVMLNIFQAENLTWGFQIYFVLPLLFFCLWILALKIKSDAYRYICLTIIAILGSFSILHGLIIPLLTITVGLLDYFKYKLINKIILITTVFINCLIFPVYFIGYIRNFQTGISILPSFDMFKYISVEISKGFFYPVNNFIYVNLVITTVVIFLLSVAIYKLISNKKKIMGYL